MTTYTTTLLPKNINEPKEVHIDMSPMSQMSPMPQMTTSRAMNFGIDNTDTEIGNINRDYSCDCCGKTIINLPPHTVLTFFMSMFILIFSFTFVANGTQTAVFIPIITSLIGLWLPSPLGAPSSRGNAVQQTKLMSYSINKM